MLPNCNDGPKKGRMVIYNKHDKYEINYGIFFVKHHGNKLFTHNGLSHSFQTIDAKIDRNHLFNMGNAHESVNKILTWVTSNNL